MKGLGIRWIFFVMAQVLLSAPVSTAGETGLFPHNWSDREISRIRALWIGSLPALPSDPSNKYADDPKAVAFGKKLFFDSDLSQNGKISCGTCHRESYMFTDDRPLAIGMGKTSRRTMPLIGAAYQAWLFWDGRKDSLWSQAIGPIENFLEHGFTRTKCAHIIIGKYGKEYSRIFGPLPRLTHKDCPPYATPSSDNLSARKAWESMKAKDREAVNRIFSNMGKAIASYVRRILPGLSRFDNYAEAISKGDLSKAGALFSAEEAEGLRLFLGKAGCINCHNGPLFTNSSFHSVGIRSDDRGRAEGIGKVLADEFNCFSSYSDAKKEECMELRFIDRDISKYEKAMKTPSLRGVADRPPYMHAGQIGTLREVLVFYQKESKSREIEHRGLTDEDVRRLEAFLKTLSSPLSAP